MNTVPLHNQCKSSDSRCSGLAATVEMLREHLEYMRSGQAITVDPEADILVVLEVGQKGYAEAIEQYCESVEADIKWASSKLLKLGCNSKCAAISPGLEMHQISQAHPSESYRAGVL